MIIFDIFNHFPSHFPILKTILCAILGYILGLLIYSPKLNNHYYAQDQFKPNKAVYFVAAGFWFITAGVYSFVVSFLTPPSMPALLGMSTFLWVGFVLPPVFLAGLFKGKPLIVLGTDSSYYLAAFYVFAVIHDVL